MERIMDAFCNHCQATKEGPFGDCRLGDAPSMTAQEERFIRSTCLLAELIRREFPGVTIVRLEAVALRVRRDPVMSAGDIKRLARSRHPGGRG